MAVLSRCRGLSLRLDSGQRTDGTVRLQLDVHVFAIDGQLPVGRFNRVEHTSVTFEFEEVEALELDGFGPRNVLDDLSLRTCISLRGVRSR